MKKDRKISTRAVLDNLTPEKQLAIIRLLSPGPQNLSLKAVRDRLAADGIKVRTLAIQGFRKRFLARWHARRAETGRLHEPDEFAGQYDPETGAARKVDIRCVLRNLPDDQQAEIMRMLSPGPENRSYAAVRAHMAAQGIKVGIRAIGNFRHWHRERQKLLDANQGWGETIAELRKLYPDLTEEQLFNEGQRLFSTLAMKKKDPVAWAKAQNVRLQHRKQTLAEKKLELKATQPKGKPPKPAAPPEPPKVPFDPVAQKKKIREIRLALFGYAPE